MKKIRSARTGNDGLKTVPLGSSLSSYVNVKGKQDNTLGDPRHTFAILADGFGGISGACNTTIPTTVNHRSPHHSELKDLKIEGVEHKYISL